jgi:hypothetical protein
MKCLTHLLLLLALTGLAPEMMGLPPRDRHSESSNSGSQERNIADKISDKEDTSTWNTYQDQSTVFTFRYPQNLVLSREGNGLKLRHSIKYKHLDPCDYSDNTKSLPRLVDFELGLEVVNERTSIDPDLKQSNDGDFGGTTIGHLKGEFERISVEGCGEYRYRFPLAGDRTLIVRREIIGIFSPTAQKFVDKKTVLKQPGVIKPEEEERLFKAILSTLKLAGAK